MWQCKLIKLVELHCHFLGPPQGDLMVNTAKLPYFLHKRIKIVVEFDLLYYHNDASNTLVLHVPYSWRPITFAVAVFTK